MTRHAALTGIFIAMTAGLAARDWPQIGGNPQHTNYTDDSPAPVEGNFWGSNKMTDWRGIEYTSFYYPIAWVKTFWPEQMLHAQPVIAEGRLFIGTLQGNLYALDARTGDRLWCFSTDSSGTGMPILQSAAVDQGRVFFGCMDGKLYASSADTGALLWETDAGSPVSASPCAADGMVFIGGRCGEFLAVNAVDGSVKWRRQLSWLIDSTAAYHEGLDIHTGLAAGLTPREISEALSQLTVYCGFPIAVASLKAMKEVFDADGVDYSMLRRRK